MLAFYNKSSIATFEVSDFTDTMNKASLGDVVYCDPPYVPLTLTANFTSYAVGVFGMTEQIMLRDLAIKISNNHIPVVISNHSTEWTLDAYADSIITEFEVRRSISASGSSRIKVKELLALFKK